MFAIEKNFTSAKQLLEYFEYKTIFVMLQWSLRILLLQYKVHKKRVGY